MASERDRRQAYWLLGVWFLSRVVTQAFALTAVKASWMEPYPGFPLRFDFWGLWLRFDGNSYLEIITSGYRPGYLGPGGWFPGYPCLVTPFQWWLPAVPSAVLVSNLCLLGGLWYLLRLAALDQVDGKRSVLLLLAFPSAFIFTAVYSESLFLLGVCAAFYYARTGRAWQACLFATLACVTRLSGLALLPALAWEFWNRRRRLDGRFVWLLLPGLGVLVFFAHLHQVTGNFWEYFQVQKVFGQLLSVWSTWERGGTFMLEQKSGLVFLVLELALLIWCWRRLTSSYRIYLVLGIFMAFYHTQGVCTQRFMLVNFPLFLFWHEKLPRRAFPYLLGLLLAGQAVLLSYWVYGYRMTY